MTTFFAILTIICIFIYVRNINKKNVELEECRENIKNYKSEISTLKELRLEEEKKHKIEIDEITKRLQDEYNLESLKTKEQIARLENNLINSTRELRRIHTDYKNKLQSEISLKNEISQKLLKIQEDIAREQQKKTEEEALLLKEKRAKEAVISSILVGLKKKREEDFIMQDIEYHKEQQQKEIEEREKYLNFLRKLFGDIGAELQKDEHDELGTIYNIVADENIDVTKLFATLELCEEENEFYVKDSENKTILYAVIDEYETTIEFIEECDTKIFNRGDCIKHARDYIFCYLENRKIKRLENSLNKIIVNGIEKINTYTAHKDSTKASSYEVLNNSEYDILFNKHIECFVDGDMLVVDYELPPINSIPTIKEYKYISSSKEISKKYYADSYISTCYENILYSITLRSIYEIFAIDLKNEISAISFNGYVTQVNPATGIMERKCILSVQVSKSKFTQINLSQVEPKACFKALKGVSAAKLIDIAPITPILTFNKKDKRFVEGKEITVDNGTNLASMYWEDFEHLVRELFEMEFAKNGGEVRVTQASRDGGVDAIIFDPDPIRGGKIVVQAKRYTNTVGVSAVRDLYGTVINEGANTGILITTADYGHDSYEFAKDKPLKLLNGGHLLALLRKNGKKAHIDIMEAKKITE